MQNKKMQNKTNSFCDPLVILFFYLGMKNKKWTATPYWNQTATTARLLIPLPVLGKFIICTENLPNVTYMRTSH